MAGFKVNDVDLDSILRQTTGQTDRATKFTISSLDISRNMFYPSSSTYGPGTVTGYKMSDGRDLGQIGAYCTSASCASSCTGCTGTCTGTCTGGCTSCTDGCSGNCTSSCGGCTGCDSGCTGCTGCTSSCGGGCAGTCFSTCIGGNT